MKSRSNPTEPTTRSTRERGPPTGSTTTASTSSSDPHRPRPPVCSGAVAVCGIESVTTTSYEGGIPFGETGPYEMVRAVLRYAVDPDAPASTGIVDLGRAARGADGTVGFESD